jgi:ribose-phosphate pyrophosphokinase
MKIFLTRSTEHLRSSLVRNGSVLGRYRLSTFADRERRYLLQEKEAGGPAAIVASILPAPESLFDLLSLHRLLLENGAGPIDLIVPYLGYARQDRSDLPGEAGIGVMVAELLVRLAASKRTVCDLHSDRIRFALGTSVAEWSALGLFATAIAQSPPGVIVAPDAGSVQRAQSLAMSLSPRPDIALIDKFRPRPNVAIARRLQGNVRGKHALILDDMIDTGGTLTEAVKLLVEKGAATIRIAATHGVFSAGAREKLAALPVSEILVTNTLPQVRRRKFRILDIVPFLPVTGQGEATRVP